jgi:hypothetical protein
MKEKDQEVFDQEALDRDEAAVKRLVAELKHIEAPANFDRRVMSRIAGGAPAKRSFFGMPALAYAAPLALLLLLVGTFFLFRSYQHPGSLEPTVANNSPNPDRPADAALAQAGVNPSTQDPTTVARTEGETPQRADNADRRQPKVPVITNSNQKRGPRSGDFTLRQTQIIRPQEFDNPNPTGVNRNDVNADASIAVSSILDSVGVTAEYANGWRVKGVHANSPALRSGVEVGDVIIALDDRDISSATDLKGSVVVRSLKIERGGAVKTIRLK